MYRSHVLVCGGTGCTSSGSEQIIKELKKEIEAVGLAEEVNVVRTGCFGLCALGPIVVIYPEGSFYSMVKEEDVKEIVDEAIDHVERGSLKKMFGILTSKRYDENNYVVLHEKDFED